MKFERIRNMREDRDLTQSNIAAVLSCSQRVYSDYECGKVSIPVESLITLSNYYDVSVDYLLGLSDNQKRK